MDLKSRLLSIPILLMRKNEKVIGEGRECFNVKKKTKNPQKITILCSNLINVFEGYYLDEDNKY